jgi:hypothetical protein
VASLVAQPLEVLWQAPLLRFQPWTLEILPIYVAFLTLLVAALPLLNRPAILLTVAVTCWAGVWLTGYNVGTWPSGGWNLNPIAWQLLFLGGAALGYVPPGRSARSVPWNRGLFTACIVLLALLRPLYGLRAEHLHAVLPSGLLQAVSALPERGPDYKTYQHPLRVMSMLAFAYVAGHLVPQEARWLRRRRAAPFVLMGQHGLPVFCTTVLASFVAQRLIQVMMDTGPYRRR